MRRSILLFLLLLAFLVFVVFVVLVVNVSDDDVIFFFLCRVVRALSFFSDIFCEEEKKETKSEKREIWIFVNFSSKISHDRRGLLLLVLMIFMMILMT